MAGATAQLFHLEQDGIIVAINPDLFDNLVMPRGFSLGPQFLAGAAEISGFPCADCFDRTG